MLIDWFTVGAQVLNFVILVWLLKRFLYKPILDAIDAREKGIAARLADADAKEAVAQKERDEFQHKNEEFDQQRVALLDKATSDAAAERQRLIDAAREAADTLANKCQESLRSDAKNLSAAINQQTQQEVFAIARQILKDLADTAMEQRVIEVFIERLRSLDTVSKESFIKGLQAEKNSVLIRSAFGLSAVQQATIKQTLQETFSMEIPLRFEINAELVGGVEVTAGGHNIAWSIAGYLGSLQNSVAELLKKSDTSRDKQ